MKKTILCQPVTHSNEAASFSCANMFVMCEALVRVKLCDSNSDFM